MVLGVASTEFQLRQDKREFFARTLHDVGAKEVRMVCYRNNPQTVVDVENLIPFFEREKIGVSVVLIDAPGAVGGLYDVRKFSEWAKAVATIVKASRFVVHNEVNNHDFWHGNAALYESLLYATRNRIKEVRDVPVVGFGLTTSFKPLSFLQQAIAISEKRRRKEPLMDELSVHPYPRPPVYLMTPAVTWVESITRFTNVPINCDEFGTLVSWHKTLNAQAEKYAFMWNKLKAIRQVRSLYVFLMQDGFEQTGDGRPWDSGLLDRDGAVKPAYRRLKALT